MRALPTPGVGTEPIPMPILCQKRACFAGWPGWKSVKPENESAFFSGLIRIRKCERFCVVRRAFGRDFRVPCHDSGARAANTRERVSNPGSRAARHGAAGAVVRFLAANSRGRVAIQAPNERIPGRLGRIPKCREALWNPGVGCFAGQERTQAAWKGGAALPAAATPCIDSASSGPICPFAGRG